MPARLQPLLLQTSRFICRRSVDPPYQLGSLTCICDFQSHSHINCCSANLPIGLRTPSLDDFGLNAYHPPAPVYMSQHSHVQVQPPTQQLTMGSTSLNHPVQMVESSQQDQWMPSLSPRGIDFSQGTLLLFDQSNVLGASAL